MKRASILFTSIFVFSAFFFAVGESVKAEIAMKFDGLSEETTTPTVRTTTSPGSIGPI